MSNNTLTSAIGLDAKIQRLQNKVYPFLETRWTGRLDGYGRAYRNIDKKGNFKFEWYNSTLKDYQDVYYNDSSQDVVFFFVKSNDSETEDNVSFNTDVKMITMCDLSKIVSNVTFERRDQEVQRDVTEALRLGGVTTITEISDNIEDIFSGVETKKIEFNNIQPLHCFSITFSLNYYLTDKCN